MKTIDMETVMICAVMAVAGALGLVAGAATFVGVRFQECNMAWVLAAGCALWGLLWGSLLIFNRNMVSKSC